MSEELNPYQIMVRDPAASAQSITDWMEGGRSLLDWAESRGMELGPVVRWIRSQPSVQQAYDSACMYQVQATQARILREVASIAHADLTGILDEDGRLLPPSEWSAEARRFVVAVEIKDTRDPVNHAQIVTTSKVKLADKLRALELLGQELGMFKRKVELSGTVNIAVGLEAARKRVAARRVDRVAKIGPADFVEAGGRGGFGGAAPAPPSSSPENAIPEKILSPISQEVLDAVGQVVAQAPADTEASRSEDLQVDGHAPRGKNLADEF